jgi:hypothetical protein
VGLHAVGTYHDPVEAGFPVKRSQVCFGERLEPFDTADFCGALRPLRPAFQFYDA